MKKSFVQALLLLGCYCAAAQQHFIKAAQTTQLIYTDFVPDRQFYFIGTSGTHQVYASDSFDVNHDGVFDVNLVYSSSGGLGGGSRSYFAYPMNQNVQFSCFTDTAIGNQCGGQPYRACNVFRANDTINNERGSWMDSACVITVYSWMGGTLNCSKSAADTLGSNYYLAGRLVSNNDSLLFYIHLGIQGPYCYLMDYACEGPEETHIVSSIPKATGNNKIRVYPNPFTDELFVNPVKPFAYQITDYAGRTVLEGKTTGTIPTANLPSGAYLLLLKNEDEVMTLNLNKAH